MNNISYVLQNKIPFNSKKKKGDAVSNGTLSHQAGLWQTRDRRLHSTFRVSSLQNVSRRAVLTHTLILLIIVDCHNCCMNTLTAQSTKFGNFVFTKV